MKLYNTATRKLETFKPQKDGEVSIYTCGPTVYGYQHIGNYSAYIYWDLLVRTMTMSGYDVKRILNLTDVGHLTSDEDSGEDKMEKGARREGKTVWEIADMYIADFLDNFHALNLVEPTKICRATDYVEADMRMVDLMTEHGYTYETEDGIYFDTSKFENYPDFAHLDLEGLRRGARVDFSDEKKNPSDFAVWKFIKPGENHAMRWDYLGRPGYPGWHLECSTIIHEELGEPIDIHTGGIDHIPVHHTNEIAQTYASTGSSLANYWLHTNFITIDGQKISKSLGNTYTLDDLKQKGFAPMDFKMWVLSGTYSGNRNFSFDDLRAAHQRLTNWRNRIVMHYQPIVFDLNKKVDDSPNAKILDLVSDNLNSAAAFAYIDSLDQDTPLVVWDFIDQLFGLNLLASTKDISLELKAKIKQREAARKEKDYATADAIRRELNDLGYDILDTADGPKWQFI